MAIVFAGRGVHELQEAQVLPLTPVPGVPAIDVLGIFPSVESLLAQGVLVGLVLYGVLATLGRRRPPDNIATLSDAATRRRSAAR